MVAFRPQFFTFLGDNIYGDTEDMAVLRAKYQQLGNQPGYQKLKTNCPVFATWDDHDFGVNDGGAEYPKKRESQQVFLDFFDADQNDARRTREGVYSAQVFGPPGERVQLILLDCRYFRSPLKTGFRPSEPGDGYRGKYVPNTDAGATILGAAQWNWLEKQLTVPAELRFIGSGVQVIADEHGSEMWGNFPHERKKLFALIKKTKAQGVVFLSGDRHLAEIARLPANHALGVGYPLYDITSSSLNTPSGNFTKAGTRFANEINSYRVGLTYFETNFGSVEIDWNQPDPSIRLQVRDAAGGVVLQQRVKLSELSPVQTDVPAANDRKSTDEKVQPVIDEVDKPCRETTVYMIGPEKAKRLAELVRKKKPKLIVECGTAVGYSGLWIARELKAAGQGKLITIEIDEDRVKQARRHFEKAGLADVVEVRQGDARKLAREIKGPVDFLFIDCNYGNYHPCFQAIEKQLAPGAVVVADNVGIGSSGMKDYLDHVRGTYQSETEWFDIDLPWGKRDAMEITVIKRKGDNSP